MDVRAGRGWMIMHEERCPHLHLGQRFNAVRRETVGSFNCDVTRVYSERKGTPGRKQLRRSNI